MTTVDIPLAALAMSDEDAAKPEEDLHPPQISPLPKGPLLVWEVDPECYVAFGAGGYLKTVIGIAKMAATWDTIPCIVLKGDTLDEARHGIADVPRPLLAQAMLLMGGGVYDVAKQVGLGKSQVSRLMSSWRDAIPELRELWLQGMSYHKVFKLAQQPTSAQRFALTGVRGPDDEPKKSLAERKKKAGAPRGSRKRPTVKNLRKFLRMLEEHRPRDAYEQGVLDTLRYAVNGQISTDSRWEDYASQHGHSNPRDHERGDPSDGHHPLDPGSDPRDRLGLVGP